MSLGSKNSIYHEFGVQLRNLKSLGSRLYIYIDILEFIGVLIKYSIYINWGPAPYGIKFLYRHGM